MCSCAVEGRARLPLTLFSRTWTNPPRTRVLSTWSPASLNRPWGRTICITCICLAAGRRGGGLAFGGAQYSSSLPFHPSVVIKSSWAINVCLSSATSRWAVLSSFRTTSQRTTSLRSSRSWTRTGYVFLAGASQRREQRSEKDKRALGPR